MNILATQYTLSNKAFEIYVSGCKAPHCKNCHNPESWNFKRGKQYNKAYFNRIKAKVDACDDLVDNIIIFGGEPFDQDYAELEELLKDLKTLNKQLWVFTKYSLEEIPIKLMFYFDYIKCGRYIPELTVEDNLQYGIKLATSNQHIYKKGLDY